MNNREYQKNYKASHKERIKFLNDRYRRNHREYLNFLARKNHAKNKKHRNFLRRKNYKNSSGEISKRYYEKHKENVLKSKKEYYENVRREQLGIKKRSFRWTKEEDFLMRKYYGNIFNRDINKKYLSSRSMNSIHRRARILKLKTSLRCSEEQKKKLSRWNTLRCKGKSFEELYGKEKAREIREKFRKKMTGENNPQYKYGKSREPYPLEWNHWLKEQVRRRDNKCKICGISRKKYMDSYNQDLIVHHIDRDKENLDFFNLVSVCVFCHGKIQHFQEDLIDFFHAKLLGLLD